MSRRFSSSQMRTLALFELAACSQMTRAQRHRVLVL
jgi:hypothetical protein